MGIRIVSLEDLLENLRGETIQEILNTFKSIQIADQTHEVEEFLHRKAIIFQKTATASTYLVFEKEFSILLGYFSLANKPLTISKVDFETLSRTQRKRFSKYGRIIGEKFQINSYLIGQIGKNYSRETESAQYVLKGRELLALAFDYVLAASRLIKAKYVWLECENITVLHNFYQDFGFREISNFQSENGLCVFIREISEVPH